MTRATPQRVALAALTLALLAPSAAAPSRTPARRRASDISSVFPGATRPDYYQRQAALLCANATPAVFPGGFAPACCTATALECAKRCSASPDCIAFRFATLYADTPPAPLDAPPGSAGATWRACELHSWVSVPSCTSQLDLWVASMDLTSVVTNSYADKLWWELPIRTGAVYYDVYWRKVFPTQAAEWLSLNVSVSGPSATALLANSTVQAAFAAAVVEAAQVVCCPAIAQVVAVNSTAPAAIATAQQQSSAVVTLRVQAVFELDLNAYAASHVAAMLASADGEAALLMALQSAGFASPSAVVVTADGAPQATPTAQSAQCMPASNGGYAAAVVIGIAVGWGSMLLVVLASAAVMLRRFGLPPRTPGGRKPGHDVFMSYRRADLAVTDAVHDKLVLAGLRVFYDRGGFLAGKPFATAIFAAIRAAPVVCLIVTLDMVRAWAEHDIEVVDYVLAELLIAMHYARRGSVRLLFPLLVGEWRAEAAAAGGGERDYLKANPMFLQLCETLPAVVPTATLALVANMFAAAGEGQTLDAVLAAATVRDLVLGRGDDELVGVLEMTGCALSGPEEQAGLVLRHRYAERIVAALAPQPRALQQLQRK